MQAKQAALFADKMAKVGRGARQNFPSYTAE